MRTPSRKILARRTALASAGAICQFARSFDTRAVDTWVIRAVHDTLQRELESDRPAFPTRASDHLEAILSDPDDLDLSIVPEVARLSGRSLDDAARNPHYERVRSVADLVMFFNEQARASEHGFSFSR